MDARHGRGATPRGCQSLLIATIHSFHSRRGRDVADEQQRGCYLKAAAKWTIRTYKNLTKYFGDLRAGLYFWAMLHIIHKIIWKVHLVSWAICLSLVISNVACDFNVYSCKCKRVSLQLPVPVSKTTSSQTNRSHTIRWWALTEWGCQILELKRNECVRLSGGTAVFLLQPLSLASFLPELPSSFPLRRLRTFLLLLLKWTVVTHRGRLVITTMALKTPLRFSDSNRMRNSSRSSDKPRTLLITEGTVIRQWLSCGFMVIRLRIVKLSSSENCPLKATSPCVCVCCPSQDFTRESGYHDSNFCLYIFTLTILNCFGRSQIGVP